MLRLPKNPIFGDILSVLKHFGKFQEAVNNKTCNRCATLSESTGGKKRENLFLILQCIKTNKNAHHIFSFYLIEKPWNLHPAIWAYTISQTNFRT